MNPETLLRDVRFGWRLLRRAPGFTAAAVLTLGLGTGVTTAVFSVLDQVVFRPLPYSEPDRLAMVWETNRARSLAHERLSPVNFGDYRALTQVFEDAAAWWYPQINLTATGREPMRVTAVEASANFFHVIGVQPALGAGFRAEPLYDRDPVAVISYRLWRDRFDSDPSIVGSSIVLSGVSHTVAGVMPQGFGFPEDTDVWQRLTWDMSQHSRGAHFMESVARLRPGTTIAAANAALAALAARLGREFKTTNGDWSARAVPLAHEVAGFFRPALFALFGAAGFLLLLTCTNVAGLLLARGTVRAREVAVRAAIGAGRSRLVQQLLTESAILALLGTATGLAVAAGAVRLLTAVSPVALPRLAAAAVDGRILIFAALVAGVTAVACGIVPALWMTRSDIQAPLRESGRGSDGGGARRVRSGLVAGEIALAVMLLVGAALVARGFTRLVAEDPGFRPTSAVAVNVELPSTVDDFARVSDFYSRVLDRVRAQPGIAASGATNFLPFEAAWRMRFLVNRRPRPPAGDEPLAQHQTVDEQYFRALGVPLLKGRFFAERDTTGSPGVVIVNRALADREWPDEDPLGQAISITARAVGPMGRVLLPAGAPYEVIGVVGDVKNRSLADAVEPALYFTHRQFPFRGMHIVVQGPVDRRSAVAAVRDAIREADPNLPTTDARSLQDVLAAQTERPRALLMLMAVFAAVALLMAAVGVYSVLSYAVAQRRVELSIRMALGATPAGVVWLVVRQGLALSAIGLFLGIAASLALGRTLSTLLNGVSPADPAAFAAAAAVVIVVAAGACMLPARRAVVADVSTGLRAG
jgi:putative ABC transport system permease protein